MKTVVRVARPLAWLVVVALTLQGFAANAMVACERHAAATVAHSDDCHADELSPATSTSDAVGVPAAAHGGTSKHGGTSPCCAVAAVASAPPRVAPGRLVDVPAAAPSVRIRPFLTPAPERPPRPLLA